MTRDVAYLLWKRQGGSLGQDNNGGSDSDVSDFDYGSGNNGFYGQDYSVSWWLTPTGMAVRYAMVAIFFAAILLYFIGGYWHASRRLRKGLPLLPYHRWMCRSRPYNSETRWQTYQQPGQTYQMESYPVPPPAYNPAEAPPPVYQPPEGGSKVMADQSYVHVRPVQEEQGHGQGTTGGDQPLPPIPSVAASTDAARL